MCRLAPYMMFLYLLSAFLHYLPEFYNRNGGDKDLPNKDRGTRFCLIKAYQVKHPLKIIKKGMGRETGQSYL